MENSPSDHIEAVIDPVDTKLVFAENKDFLGAMRFVSDMFDQLEESDQIGSIIVSLDSGNYLETKASMRLCGARTVVDNVIEGMGNQGDINFAIDVSVPKNPDNITKDSDNNSENN